MTSTARGERDAGDLPDWSRARRVLLVRLRSIGDTVLMTPCLAALKAFIPDIEITVLSEPLAAPLLEDHPLVDRLVVVPPAFGARAKVVAQLRREKFDVAFNLHGGSTAMFLTRLSGARHTTGYRDYRYSSLLTRPAPAPDEILNQKQVHSVEQQLALLYWMGVPRAEATPRLSLSVTEAATRQVRDRLRREGVVSARETGGGFAVISPAAAMESKRWSIDSFARVTEHLADRWDLPGVVIAGPGQEHIAREVASKSEAKPRVVTGLSLKELMALISLSSLFVGNDSGPMHMAAAFCRPVVAVFGSSNADVWRPWADSPTRFIRADEKLDPVTRIAGIRVEEVKAAVDEVMQEAMAADFKAAVK